MTKKTFQIMAVCAVVISLFVLPGCGKRKPETFEKKLDMMAEKLSKELKLSADQQKTADEIKAAILKKHEQMRRPDRAEEEKEVKKAFTEAILSDKFDQAKLKKVLNAKREKMDEMGDFMLKELAVLHSVLTPEQRKDLAKIVENGPWPGMGPGPRMELKRERGQERGPEPKQETKGQRE